MILNRIIKRSILLSLFISSNNIHSSLSQLQSDGSYTAKAIDNLINRNNYSTQLVKAARQHRNDIITCCGSTVNHYSTDMQKKLAINKLDYLILNPKKNISSHIKQAIKQKKDIRDLTPAGRIINTLDKLDSHFVTLPFASTVTFFSQTVFSYLLALKLYEGTEFSYIDILYTFGLTCLLYNKCEIMFYQIELDFFISSLKAETKNLAIKTAAKQKATEL